MKDAGPVWQSLPAVDDLPTLPIIAFEVASLLDDAGSTPERMTEVMKSDPVLTAKVLRLINSPYYSIPGGVSTVDRAVGYLGYNTLFQLLIGVSVFEADSVYRTAKSAVHAMWRHALSVALMSEIVAQRIGYPDPKEIFTAGLLHDIGKLVLADVAPVLFGNAIEQIEKKGGCAVEAEMAQGLPTHDQAGEKLAENWRFPPVLRAAIGLHHLDFPTRVSRAPAGFQPVLDIVILADEMSRRFVPGAGTSPAVGDLDPDLLDRLGMSDIDASRIRGEMDRRIGGSKIFLSIFA